MAPAPLPPHPVTPSRVALIAAELSGRLTGARVRRVCRFETWSLGLALASGQTLGLRWEPARPLLGLCSWEWPRGSPGENLSALLHGARIAGASVLEGEPVLLLHLEGAPAARLVWEALGRSSNALLLNADDVILWAARTLGGSFRTGRAGEAWAPPPSRPRAEPAGDSFDARVYLLEEAPRRLREDLASEGRRLAAAKLSQRERALKRKIEAVEGDRREAEEWLALEGAARGLLASGDLARRGEPFRRVTDWTLDPPREVEVALDPAKSVRENAGLLFKRVQKAKARMERTVGLLAEAESKLDQIRAERRRVEGCDDLRLLFPEPKSPKKQAHTPERSDLPKGVVRLDLPLEFVGYAGKNAAGNDAVSFKIGRGADFWFHAEDYAGCHVVVRNPSRLPALPPAVEKAAALFAARHSGAPEGNRVAVCVSRCKFLRRVPGAPGRVMLSSRRTLFVDLPKTR
jgi:predicted ribosome quality control (RQC) complex YloA/Tae2 family protein